MNLDDTLKWQWLPIMVGHRNLTNEDAIWVGVSLVRLVSNLTILEEWGFVKFVCIFVAYLFPIEFDDPDSFEDI